MENYELIPFDNALALAQAAAQAWVTKVRGAVQNRPFLAALSGGRVARDFFSAIVRSARELQTSLAPVHFFWADERCVPPDDAESNFKVANQLLFQPLAIAPDHIHRIRGELSPEEAAREASTDLRSAALAVSRGQPVLDLILLGMGEDGHVASLFPEMPVKLDSKETYLAVTATKPPPQRITLSYAAIAAAREVWVLASGPGKEEALQKSLMLRGQTPLARVLGMRQNTKIFSDIKVP